MNTLYRVTKIENYEFKEIEKALLPVIVPLEQSPIWGKFDDSIINRIFLGSFKFTDQNDKLIALASATLYKQKGRNWIWIKHGPLFASVPNTSVIKKMCSTLNNYFSDVDGTKPVFIRLTMPSKITSLKLPFEHTMYDQTVVVDLTQTEEEILSGMSQSGRRGVRSYYKNKLLFKEVTTNRSDFFKKHCYPILKETGIRDNFGIHPLSLYVSMLDKLSGVARLYITQNNHDQVLTWAITTEYNSQSMYYYGGSSKLARDTFAAYGLHFEIMKQMKSRGNKTYDFMGIAGKNFEELSNVTQFKVKFSKNIVDTPVTYDLPLIKTKYSLISNAIKIKRKLR